jgi:hypothetical protein
VSHSLAGSPCRRLSYVTLLVLCCASIAACVSGSGTVGGGNIPPSTRLRVLGTPGTPFSAVITDRAASWQMTGVVPLSVAVLNDQPPLRMIAVKLTGDSSLLSVEIVFGGTVVELSSSRDPFGSAAVQTATGLTAIAPPAVPDTRFLVKGATGELYNGLIEDLNRGFELGDIVPTLFLFENPDGRVDGFFNRTSQNAGPLQVDLLIDGQLVANAVGNPSVSIKSP